MKHKLILLLAALAVSAAQAQTTNVFSIQKGNLTKDGTPYGSGTGYLGVLDGVLTDANATALLTATPAVMSVISTGPAALTANRTAPFSPTT